MTLEQMLLSFVGLLLGIVILIAELVRRYMRESCPEEGCHGHLRFKRDEIRDGIPVAIWDCSSCHTEQVIPGPVPNVTYAQEGDTSHG